MRLHRFLFFLTLVLSSTVFLTSNLAIGAPESELKSTDTRPLIVRETSEDTPPVFATRKLAFNSTTLGLIIWNGRLKNKDVSESAMGVQYLATHYFEQDSAIEYGVDFLQNSILAADLGMKMIWELERLEPFIKYGIGALYLSSDGLPTFFNKERYQLRFAAGTENLNRNRSLRMAAGFAYSLLGLSYYLSVGFAF